MVQIVQTAFPRCQPIRIPGKPSVGTMKQQREEGNHTAEPSGVRGKTGKNKGDPSPAFPPDGLHNVRAEVKLQFPPKIEMSLLKGLLQLSLGQRASQGSLTSHPPPFTLGSGGVCLRKQLPEGVSIPSQEPPEQMTEQITTDQTDNNPDPFTSTFFTRHSNPLLCPKHAQPSDWIVLLKYLCTS